MRKAGLIVLAISLVFATGTNASAGLRDSRRWRMVRLQGLDRQSWTYREVKLSIEAAVDRWSVYGGVSKALSVADCESGLREQAYNSYSGASGVFQMLKSTFREWRRAMIDAHSRIDGWRWRWKLRREIFDARINVVVAIWHAHRQGWGAWTCQ